MSEQKDLTAASLPDWLLGLPRDSDGRNAMDRAARTFARPDAAKAIPEKALMLSGCQERPDVFEIVSGDCGHDEHRSGAHEELRQLGRPVASVRRLANLPPTKHGALLSHVDLALRQPTGDFTVAEPWRRERTAGNSRCPGARGSAHGPRSISSPRSSSACPSSTTWIRDSTNGCTPDRLTVDRVFGSGE